MRHQRVQQLESEARVLTYDGLTAMDRGRPDRAEQLLTQAAELAPNDYRIQEYLANCLVEQGQLQTAIEHFEQALTLSPGEPRLNVQMGQVYLRQRRADLAEAQARFALERDRRNFTAWELLGQAQSAQGELDAALTSFHRATGYEPDHEGVQLEIARIYHQQGRHERALATIEGLRRNYPTNREPIDLLALEGKVLLSLNRPARVVSRLAQIIERPNVNSDVLWTVCEAYRQVGDFSNARWMAAVAHERFPHDHRFAQLIGELPGVLSEEIVETGLWR